MLLVVIATPAPLPAEVDRSRWPVHVTVAGNFRVDERDSAAVPHLLLTAARGIRPFEVALGPAARFGRDASIPVLLAPHPSLDAVHAALAESLSALPSFDPLEPQYWGEGYRPHASLGRAVGVADGDALPLTVLSLFALEARAGLRLAQVELGLTPDR